jgi:hypothetical protein
MTQMAQCTEEQAIENRSPGGEPQGGAARSVRACFGRRWVWPELLASLQAGSILELDGDAASHVELYVDGRLAGFGSAVVAGERLCVRMDRHAAGGAPPSGEEPRAIA